MLSRRSFLNTTIGAGAALATQRPYNAAAQVDRRMIVDAQIHLWKADTEDWKWVPGAVAQLPATPLTNRFYNELMFLADGDLLAVEIELAANIWKTVADESLKPLAPVDPGPNQL